MNNKEKLRHIVRTIINNGTLIPEETYLDELETYINKVRGEAEQEGYFKGLQANQMKDLVVDSSSGTKYKVESGYYCLDDRVKIIPIKLKEIDKELRKLNEKIKDLPTESVLLKHLQSIKEKK